MGATGLSLVVGASVAGVSVARVSVAGASLGASVVTGAAVEVVQSLQTETTEEVAGLTTVQPE
jgi:hypothetical protein